MTIPEEVQPFFEPCDAQYLRNKLHGDEIRWDAELFVLEGRDMTREDVLSLVKDGHVPILFIDDSSGFRPDGWLAIRKYYARAIALIVNAGETLTDRDWGFEASLWKSADRRFVVVLRVFC